MTATYCKCPDGEVHTIAQCLAHCPRTEGRCLTLPTLHEVFRQREWTGVPSTTQLLNGTRMEYLKLTEAWTIDPMDRAFALLGTRHHGQLQRVAEKLNVLAEEKLAGEVSGIFDLLEPDELAEEETYTLTDYKTWGSFKVGKALGIRRDGKRPDPSGEVYKTSGKWGQAGTPKMIDVWVTDPASADMFNEELQLNNYRMMVEECGFPVSRIRIQATVRDGGLAIATSRGIDKNIYMIDVALRSNGIVAEYFQSKRAALLAALETHTLPPPCSDYERWDGRRCHGFCEVAEFCDIGQAEMVAGGE